MRSESHAAGPLNYYLGRRIDAELQLGALPVVHREPLHEEGGESGSRSPSEGVEDQEALCEKKNIVAIFIQRQENKASIPKNEGNVPEFENNGKIS